MLYPVVSYIALRAVISCLLHGDILALQELYCGVAAVKVIHKPMQSVKFIYSITAPCAMISPYGDDITL